MREAQFYTRLEGGKVHCQLCARGCFITPGKSGLCGVRKNIGGKLYSQVYGKSCSVSIDPIEKKPLFHFLPGTNALSICTMGCNFKCRFCQNFSISQVEGGSKILGQKMSPKRIVEIAKKEGVGTIAYTYTEPTVFFEYALDTMKLAKKAGLRNIWVSNGYINKAPLKKMAKYLDAVNVDVKGNEDVYKNLCLASQKPVLESLKEFKKQGIWIEITSLVIPGQNDSLEWMEELSGWIAENLGTETPLHLSRFFPTYKMTYTPPTPQSTLEFLHKVAHKKLKYVYIGNIRTEKYENTYCPRCGEIVIGRENYRAEFRGAACRKCGEQIEGIFEPEKPEQMKKESPESSSKKLKKPKKEK